MRLEWERKHPGRVENTFNALARVTPSHLMDAALYDFKGLRPTGVADADGDLAFDEESCADAPGIAAQAIRFA